MGSDAYRHVLVDSERRFEARDPERFDRIAFAMQALSLLRPPRMTIAVYASVSNLTVERGRDPTARDATSWATVGIPPDASRESIALALAELAGVGRTPFMVELLVYAGRCAEAS